MNPNRIDGHLALLGVPRPASPDPQALADSQWRHPSTVPFENPDIHLGRPLSLDQDTLLAKIPDRRRGGLCYELCGAFAVLPRELGYRVTLLSAYTFEGSGHVGIAFDPLALRVDPEHPWLVDVGFGRFSDRTLIRTTGTDRHEEPLVDDAALPAAYREHFGVTLDRVPTRPANPPIPADTP